MIMKKWCGLISLLVGLTILGCQNYSFEELPSSVIKESRRFFNITISTEADILFVIDNSRSMVGEQLQLGKSFEAFTNKLEEFFGDKYRIAVITTGVESAMCPACDALPVPGSCMNESGESGRFQENICHNDGTIDDPDYSCVTDPNCGKVLLPADKTCFFDTTSQSGRALTGVNGCGLERGLSAIKKALVDLSGTWNSGFLRPSATLVIIVISDEEDCGEVGDVNEGPEYGSGRVCYYASKGVDGDGNFADIDGKPYRLTPVEDYYRDFMSIKDGRVGMVKFAAIVGVKDINDLSTTTINYVKNGNVWVPDHACTTKDCSGPNCSAEPGTRYIELAQLFGIGKNGFIDTICQDDFSDTLGRIVTLAACPRQFLLSEEILDPDLANILINEVAVPRYSCSHVGEAEECSGPGDSCSQGECLETWTYCAPSGPIKQGCPEQSPDAPGGKIIFADHYDPCDLFPEGAQVHIELVYVTP